MISQYNKTHTVSSGKIGKGNHTSTLNDTYCIHYHTKRIFNNMPDNDMITILVSQDKRTDGFI